MSVVLEPTPARHADSPGAALEVASALLDDNQSRVGPPDPVDGGVEVLVQAAADGDRDAWNGLVDRFASVVWAVARGHGLSTLADAADVSQTTWLRLLDHLRHLEPPDRVGDWLATTARREAPRVIRISGRQVPHGDDLDLRRPIRPRRQPPTVDSWPEGSEVLRLPPGRRRRRPGS